jgi:hypothetical protein
MELSGAADADDQASPLVMAVASSPRVSRKRLGSNSTSNNNTSMENNGTGAKDDLPGVFFDSLFTFIPFSTLPLC